MSFSKLSEAEKQQAREDLKELRVKTQNVISKVRDTVTSLRKAADKLDGVWNNCNKVRGAGRVGTVAGLATIAAAGLTVVTGGAALPLFLGGLGVAAGGAVTTVRTSIYEADINSSEIEKAIKDFQETLDAVKNVNSTIDTWLANKEEERLSHICHLAKQTYSDPAVIEILQKKVVPRLSTSVTLLDSAIFAAMDPYVKEGVQACVKEAMGEALQEAKQIERGSLLKVCALFVAGELKDLRCTIKNMIQKKGSDASPYLRQMADELKQSVEELL